MRGRSVPERMSDTARHQGIHLMYRKQGGCSKVGVSLEQCQFIIIILLLLAAPTWLWGRCGRHNSPPASSVMDLV